ncbi:hypothetical protein DVH24_006413 [Malus domestica]|uniref:Uncharacterized protein n=1 Tax=Malus domestica TaxID=3750 RepID=A0A498KCR7_MALDO|nr:hypothetical protein DVH24_006413 [Malus domestica]
MLLQLEQECLDIYRKKIEMTRKHRADLHRYLPDGQTQIKAIVSAFGKLTPFLAKEGPSKTNCLPSNLFWTNWNPVWFIRCSPVTEEYTAQRQESEEDKRKSREATFGSRPSTKKPLGQSTSANNMIGTPIGRRTPLGRHGVSAGKERRESGRAHNAMPINYVALPKDDSVSRRN